jgi:hypothetical protein
MNRLSALFHQKIDPLLFASELSNVTSAGNSSVNLTSQSSYRQALLYNLLLETSCFRYWGQGAWTDYAREIYQRGETFIGTNF